MKRTPAEKLHRFARMQSWKCRPRTRASKRRFLLRQPHAGQCRRVPLSPAFWCCLAAFFSLFAAAAIFRWGSRAVRRCSCCGCVVRSVKLCVREIPQTGFTDSTRRSSLVALCVECTTAELCCAQQPRIPNAQREEQRRAMRVRRKGARTARLVKNWCTMCTDCTASCRSQRTRSSPRPGWLQPPHIPD